MILIISIIMLLPTVPLSAWIAYKANEDLFSKQRTNIHKDSL